MCSIIFRIAFWSWWLTITDIFNCSFYDLLVCFCFVWKIFLRLLGNTITFFLLVHYMFLEWDPSKNNKFMYTFFSSLIINYSWKGSQCMLWMVPHVEIWKCFRFLEYGAWSRWCYMCFFYLESCFPHFTMCKVSR